MPECPCCHQELPLVLEKKCEVCGKRFQPVRRHKMYCSDTCKTTAYRRRKKLLAKVSASLNA